MESLLLYILLLLAPIPKEPRPDAKAPGFMGVQFEEVDKGILLSSVYADSPAFRAGLEPNDIITKFSGRSLGKISSVQEMIFNTPPNTVIPLDVLRGDKILSIKIRIGYRPADFPFTPRPSTTGDDDP